jgi:hypothetical protein
MIKRFGFRVIKEERGVGDFIERNFGCSDYPYYEDKKLIIRFVEVELNTPAYPNMAYCSLYYEKNRARTEIVSLVELKKLYPKSYAELNSGEEYTKEFGELE